MFYTWCVVYLKYNISKLDTEYSLTEMPTVNKQTVAVFNILNNAAARSL